MQLRSILKRRLVAITKRLARNTAPVVDPFSKTALSYKDSEAASERRNMVSMQRDLQARLSRREEVAEVHTDDLVASLTRSRVANYQAAAAAFERQGDYRQASLYRQAILGAEEAVAREHGVIR